MALTIKCIFIDFRRKTFLRRAKDYRDDIDQIDFLDRGVCENAVELNSLAEK